MITITAAAIAKLKAIQVLHPEDPIVRISVRDLDDARLSFSITLEAQSQHDDDVQQIDDLTIAVARQSSSRLDGVTIDYSEVGGFRFLHDDGGHNMPLLTIPSLN
jgi:Fe-S cluster assembly iron-binding protein IscA